ncbi:hypothetical protein ACRRTK_019653 [Alexandromys fortis]
MASGQGPGALWRCGFPGTYNAAVNTLVGSTLVGNTLVGSTLVGSTLVGSMLETSEQVWDKELGASNVSKIDLLDLTRALALELAPRSIRVNCLVPGIIKTTSAKWPPSPRSPFSLQASIPSPPFSLQRRLISQECCREFISKARRPFCTDPFYRHGDHLQL